MTAKPSLAVLVAISTLQSGLPTELLVSDMKPGLAEGEAMDLAHGAAFYATATVRAAFSSATAFSLSPASGTPARPSTCTGVDGPEV